MPHKLNEIAQQLNGSIVGSKDQDIVIRHILTDSRQLISAEDCLFFAISTARNDGHKYIKSLFEKGVKCFVVSKLPENPFDESLRLTFILVKDTLLALQQLAAFHRQLFNYPVIGITGSNGKTVIKEWLNQLLTPDKAVVRSPKSYNSQIGVPLSVWQMDNEHHLAIFEAGISEPGEMEHLQAIIKPTIGLFTNIGPAHGENFMHIEQKVGEKLKLFTRVETLIYCADQPEVQSGIIRSQLLHSIKPFTWSQKGNADLNVLHVENKIRKTIIRAMFQDNACQISIPFTDEASIENAIHCWSVMLVLGYSQEVIEARMSLLSPVAMRLELKEGVNNCTLINDSYNSDVHSLAIALDFLNQQNQHRSKLLILSDILESGRNEPELYSQIAQLLEAKGVENLIGIGPAITRQSGLFLAKARFFETTEAFLDAFPLQTLQDKSILIKGARKFGFERISHLLQQKAHETVLEINLNNLIANLNHYRSLLKPEVKIMLMVKAFSYGSGSFEIANALQFHRVDYLAVAYADEGVELRRAGISLPVMVMSPEEHSFAAMLHHRLEPEIFSFRVLDLLEEAVVQSGLEKRTVKIHLKIDTGMRRLGFDAKEIPALIERIKSNPMLEVQSVFSHLAASENTFHDAFTLQQISIFELACEQLRLGLGKHFDRHILNSAGISRFHKAHFEMVRLGIGVYGVAVAEWEKERLEHVISLKSSLSQIKLVPEGESVGYNRSSFTKKDSRIGIVPIGYADGLPRTLSNGIGKLYVNGRPAPIVGDVCMDMCMIDLRDIPAEEGDEVIVFDNKRSILDLSKDAGTIPYEILTRISRRVKRVYFQE
jgi:Alr-MurF fusion protein